LNHNYISKYRRTNKALQFYEFSLKTYKTHSYASFLPNPIVANCILGNIYHISVFFSVFYPEIFSHKGASYTYSTTDKQKEKLVEKLRREALDQYKRIFPKFHFNIELTIHSLLNSLVKNQE
jgi:hypothetical protein